MVQASMPMWNDIMIKIMGFIPTPQKDWKGAEKWLDRIRKPAFAVKQFWGFI